MKKRRPDLTEEVREAIAQAYLRGDKTILIQFKYKVSPGELYRILHEHRVKLRKSLITPMIFPQLPAGSSLRVDIWKLMLSSQYLRADTVMEMIDVIVGLHLDSDPHGTLACLGLGNTFTIDAILQRGMEMYIEFLFSHDTKFRRLDDGSWCMRDFEPPTTKGKILKRLNQNPDRKYSEIAIEIGVSRERVRQIARRNGYPPRHK